MEQSLEKNKVTVLFKKFPTLYRTSSAIIMFTRACHWNCLERGESSPHPHILFLETPLIIPALCVQTCVEPVSVIVVCSGRPQRMQQGLPCLS